MKKYNDCFLIYSSTLNYSNLKKNQMIKKNIVNYMKNVKNKIQKRILLREKCKKTIIKQK